MFNTLQYELGLPACAEPYKPWAHQFPLDMHQNNFTQVFNCAWNSTSGVPSCNKPNETHATGGHLFSNFAGDVETLGLRNWSGFDFVPGNNSKLVNAGAIVPPFTDGYVGAAPDIGAYELGGLEWTAGVSWAAPTDLDGALARRRVSWGN